MVTNQLTEDILINTLDNSISTYKCFDFDSILSDLKNHYNINIEREQLLRAAHKLNNYNSYYLQYRVINRLASVKQIDFIVKDLNTLISYNELYDRVRAAIPMTTLTKQQLQLFIAARKKQNHVTSESYRQFTSSRNKMKFKVKLIDMLRDYVSKLEGTIVIEDVIEHFAGEYNKLSILTSMRRIKAEETYANKEIITRGQYHARQYKLFIIDSMLDDTPTDIVKLIIHAMHNYNYTCELARNAIESITKSKLKDMHQYNEELSNIIRDEAAKHKGFIYMRDFANLITNYYNVKLSRELSLADIRIFMSLIDNEDETYKVLFNKSTWDAIKLFINDVDTNDLYESVFNYLIENKPYSDSRNREVAAQLIVVKMHLQKKKIS